MRAQVDRILSEQLARAERIVREKQAHIEKLVEALAEREVMPGDDVALIIGTIEDR